MLCFENDYSEGAHEEVLKRLVETNMEQLPGYGTDRYTQAAKEKIRAACGCPDADIYFLTGGTQTNQAVISSMLDTCEGVVAAETGHIGTHEAGAIEWAGHKVLTLPQEEGKLSADVLEEYLSGFYRDANHEHMVFPGMVYISHPTEYGTLYTKGELAELSAVCAGYNIPLYLKIGKNAIDTAEELKRALREKGYEFYIESPTNQIFVVLEDTQIERLRERVVFSFWEKMDEKHTVVRFATSWATKMEDVKKLAALL